MGEGFWEEGGEEERRNKSQGKGGEAGRGWEERRNNEGRGREERTEEEAGGQSPVEPRSPGGSSAGGCCAGTRPRTPCVSQGLRGRERRRRGGDLPAPTPISKASFERKVWAPSLLQVCVHPRHHATSRTPWTNIAKLSILAHGGQERAALCCQKQPRKTQRARRKQSADLGSSLPPPHGVTPPPSAGRSRPSLSSTACPARPVVYLPKP